ncbi:hypothetical protein, partial [Escherichia coli]|uniref:hypothetical protein n=1 Tax=Escherichia coli TaxID=562 RepID=UPI001C0AA89B
WEGWAILLRQKQKKLIMLPSETMIWQPEFTDKTLSRKPGAVQYFYCNKIWLIYKLHWGKKLSGMFLRSKASSRIAFAKTQERSPLHQYS